MRIDHRLRGIVVVDEREAVGDRYREHEKDRGQAHAINKGLRLATGEILAYLNSDDVYEPGALQRMGQYYLAHPQARWVTGVCRFIDSEGQEIRKPITLYKRFWLRLSSFS